MFVYGKPAGPDFFWSKMPTLTFFIFFFKNSTANSCFVWLCQLNAFCNLNEIAEYKALGYVQALRRVQKCESKPRE